MFSHVYSVIKATLRRNIGFIIVLFQFRNNLINLSNFVQYTRTTGHLSTYCMSPCRFHVLSTPCLLYRQRPDYPLTEQSATVFSELSRSMFSELSRSMFSELSRSMRPFFMKAFRMTFYCVGFLRHREFANSRQVRHGMFFVWNTCICHKDNITSPSELVYYADAVVLCSYRPW